MWSLIQAENTYWSNLARPIVFTVHSWFITRLNYSNESVVLESSWRLSQQRQDGTVPRCGDGKSRLDRLRHSFTGSWALRAHHMDHRFLTRHGLSLDAVRSRSCVIGSPKKSFNKTSKHAIYLPLTFNSDVVNHAKYTDPANLRNSSPQLASL